MKKTKDLLLSAKEALVQKKIDKSIELFSKVIELEPENSVALFSRGTDYFSKKKIPGVPTWFYKMYPNKARQCQAVL